MEVREGLSVDFSKNRERAQIKKTKPLVLALWAVLRFFYRSKGVWRELNDHVLLS